VESGIGFVYSDGRIGSTVGANVDSWLVVLAEHGRFVFGCHRISNNDNVQRSFVWQLTVPYQRLPRHLNGNHLARIE
jgi:hypothetical protein